MASSIFNNQPLSFRNEAEPPIPPAPSFYVPASEQGIDLNEQLVRNRPATFIMRVNSDALSGSGIQRGDVVIVDRSLEPHSGKVIIASVDGELLIRRLEINQGKKRLITDGKLAPIEMDGHHCSLWGVVTYVIHSV
jgi:DNA polymerase V